ncbi:hypothetical protein [uncultured Campylobacter sp.]|uniref:hypothetical protein n=1 Tax=uncultured Campylobacter sp. TaxID=218934 RepID=UPI002624D49F|nr:hypothetical protein [uncultured Campylobacter sp.]
MSEELGLASILKNGMEIEDYFRAVFEKSGKPAIKELNEKGLYLRIRLRDDPRRSGADAGAG